MKIIAKFEESQSEVEIVIFQQVQR